MMRCLIVLSLLASTTGLKVANTEEGIKVEKKKGESFAEVKTGTLLDASNAYATAKERLVQMHFANGFAEVGNDQGTKIESNYLVQTSKETLAAALTAIGPELKVDPKTGKIPSLYQWFKSQGYEAEYADIMKTAASIPLDDETEQFATEIGTGFRSMLMETSAKLKASGGSKNVPKKALTAILEKHTAASKEKMKKFASKHKPIDVSLLALTYGDRAAFNPFAPRNTNYDTLECGMMAHALAQQGQDFCVDLWKTTPLGLSMNATTNSAACIGTAHDYYSNTCAKMGIKEVAGAGKKGDYEVEVNFGVPWDDKVH